MSKKQSFAEAVILAAGLGTRLKSIAKDKSKVMVKIGKLTILEHQVKLLSYYNFRKILIVIRRKKDSEEISKLQLFRFGAEIIFNQVDPKGTSYALNQSYSKLSDQYILLYGDIMTNISLKKMFEYHQNKYADLTIAYHNTDHPSDSDLLRFDKQDNLLGIFRINKNIKNKKYFSSGGIFIIKKSLMKKVEKTINQDFVKDTIPYLLQHTNLNIKVYNTRSFMKDVGTVARLYQVRKKYSDNIDYINEKKSAIFLDRDGTIIKDINLLHKKLDVEILPKAASAIRKINKLDKYVIIITNQSVVARGLCTEEELIEIHHLLINKLAKYGARIDSIYYCPHHPDKGFEGENIKYKKRCNCRKPNIGLIKKACQDYSIDLSRSWFIGDTSTDIMTGKKAGIKTILVKTGKWENNISSKPDVIVEDIYSAVKWIAKGSSLNNI